MSHRRDTPGEKRNWIYAAIILAAIVLGILAFVLVRPHASQTVYTPPGPPLSFTCDASQGSPVDWVVTNNGGTGTTLFDINGTYGNGTGFSKVINNGQGVYVAPGQTVSGEWFPVGNPPGDFSRSCTITSDNTGLRVGSPCTTVPGLYPGGEPGHRIADGTAHGFCQPDK